MQLNPIVSMHFSSWQKTLGQYQEKGGVVSPPYHFNVALGGAGFVRDDTKHPYILCLSSSVILIGTRIITGKAKLGRIFFLAKGMGARSALGSLIN